MIFTPYLIGVLSGFCLHDTAFRIGLLFTRESFDVHCIGFILCFSHPLCILCSIQDEWKASRVDSEVQDLADTGLDRLRDIGLVAWNFRRAFI